MLAHATGILGEMKRQCAEVFGQPWALDLRSAHTWLGAGQPAAVAATPEAGPAPARRESRASSSAPLGIRPFVLPSRLAIGECLLSAPGTGRGLPYGNDLLGIARQSIWGDVDQNLIEWQSDLMGRDLRTIARESLYWSSTAPGIARQSF